MINTPFKFVFLTDDRLGVVSECEGCEDDGRTHPLVGGRPQNQGELPPRPQSTHTVEGSFQISLVKE